MSTKAQIEKKEKRQRRKPRPLSKDASVRRAWSIDEFCDRWGVGRNTAYALIASGDLESSKIGSRRVITLEQEERFAQRMEEKGAA